MEAMLLVLDQGTTSSRAILLDQQGQMRGMAQQEFTQHYPYPGWVEHDAREIWATQLDCARQVLRDQQVSPGAVQAIGITNQRETTVVWDRRTGEPVAPAIVWQDRRTAAHCHELESAGHGHTIQEKTGLVLDAYFSATKLAWILRSDPDLMAAARQGHLAFGTIDSWLIWKLSGGRNHFTDASNASRTLLYNIRTGEWDPELLNLFEVQRGLLPEVRDSNGDFGETAAELFGHSIPIRGVAGDQQAALFGQMCVQPGMLKNTYGTGCFLMLNTGSEIIPSRNRLLTTVAWQMGGKRTYALEGSVFIAGAAVQWLRDGLGLVKQAPEIEVLARSVPDNGGVYFVPAFTGLGSPYWDPQARGSILGITRGTTSAHLARATLEAIAFQTMDVLSAMNADISFPLQEMRVDGGAAANDLLLQFQADLLELPIDRPANLESTALGAGFLAGLGSGFWENLDSLADIRQSASIFLPQPDKAVIHHHKEQWARAINRARDWQT